MKKVYLTVDELKQISAELGYELRRKGHKIDKKQVVDENGNPVKNCYFPHIALTASGNARTWKMFDGAKVAFGYAKDKNGEVWEDKLLLACEHIVRFVNRKIDDKELGKSIMRLVSPLPKSEYVKRVKKGGK